MVHPVPRRAVATRPVLRVRALLLGGRRAHARIRAVAHLGLDGLPGNVLAQRWGVPQVGLFRRLGSTLDAIHDLGAQDAPHGTVVLAEEQTAGRAPGAPVTPPPRRSEEHTSELQSQSNLVCRLLLEKKKKKKT